MLDQLLPYCYFLGLLAAILKTSRYAVDAHRNRQAFYLIGVPANLALAGALFCLAASVGGWSGEWLRLGVRFSFMLWAVLALIFEIVYIGSFTNIKREVAEGEICKH